MKKTREKKTFPEWLARLQNEIAGNLPGKQYKDWIARLVNAVETNTDFEDCRHRFLARLLRECLVFDREQNPECADAINAIAELHDRWQDVDESAWYAAESAAWSAAKSAWYAAWSAAESAAWSGKSAAKSAAWLKIADILLEEVER